MAGNQSIADLRREYALAGLRRADLHANPIVQFDKWFQQPHARIVLLKNISENGFTFFTNYESRKGSELSANPHASLVLFWPELERQICIAGSVSKVSRAESKKYFDSR